MNGYLIGINYDWLHEDGDDLLDEAAVVLARKWNRTPVVDHFLPTTV